MYPERDTISCVILTTLFTPMIRCERSPLTKVHYLVKKGERRKSGTFLLILFPVLLPV